MKRHSKATRLALAIAATIALSLAVAACGGSDSTSDDSSTPTDATAQEDGDSQAAAATVGLECAVTYSAEEMIDYQVPKATDDYSVALLEVSLAGYYYQAMAFGAQQAADEAGVELTVLGGQGYQDPSQQLTDAQDLINRGVDGLVLAPVDPRGSAAIVDNADAKGIPVVNVSTGVESEKATKLLQDDYEQGQTSARALVELAPEGGEGIVMGGPENGEWSNLRVQGFEDELAKHPEFEIATVTHQEVDPAAGLENFESAVQAHPDPQWVYSVYAYVLTAESIPSRYSDVPYVTTSYEPLVIEALENGSIDSTVANDPVAMGRMGVGFLVAELNGEEVPSGTVCLPNTPLDKADIGTPVADFELYPESYEAE